MTRLAWTFPALASLVLLSASGVEAQNAEERAVIAAAQAVFDAMASDEEGENQVLRSTLSGRDLGNNPNIYEWGRGSGLGT